MTKFFIKILTLIIVFNIYLNFPVFAGISDNLSKIENSIFGFDYKNDSNENRVKRLEKTIYGQTGSGNINNRISKLSGDISADVIGLEIPAVRDTFLAEENAEEESNVNYPIVDEIEQKLFNKTYKNRDFHTRIVTIEKKLFGKIYDVDDYSKRMERIKAKIAPEYIANNEEAENYDNYDRTYTDANRGNSFINKFKMPFGQKNYTRPYTNYGDYNNTDNSMLSKENLYDDLTQLEYDTFGTEFSNEDVKTRIKRLNSAQKAQKSKQKYDSQKFSQHMSTAMEIGAMILMILAMVL